MKAQWVQHYSGFVVYFHKAHISTLWLLVYKFSNKKLKIDKKAEKIPCDVYDFSYEENHEQEMGKPVFKKMNSS